VDRASAGRRPSFWHSTEIIIVADFDGYEKSVRLMDPSIYSLIHGVHLRNFTQSRAVGGDGRSADNRLFNAIGHHGHRGHTCLFFLGHHNLPLPFLNQYAVSQFNGYML